MDRSVGAELKCYFPRWVMLLVEREGRFMPVAAGFLVETHICRKLCGVYFDRAYYGGGLEETGNEHLPVLLLLDVPADIIAEMQPRSG